MRGDENEMKGNKKGSEPENTIIAPDPSLVASKEDKGKITEINNGEIELVREDYEKVVKDAINSYNAFNENKASERKKFHYIPATIDSDSAFLKRITTNYLRHKLSNYEDKLVRIFGKTGKTKAYIVINRKIAGKIAEVYPELA